MGAHFVPLLQDGETIYVHDVNAEGNIVISAVLRNCAVSIDVPVKQASELVEQLVFAIWRHHEQVMLTGDDDHLTSS